MTDREQTSELPWLGRWRRLVPLAVWVVVALTMLLIPLRIIGYGYLPGGDALRHAAKAVSGRPWSEILVLNSVYQIDHEFGWNLLLAKIHTLAGADTETLVLLSVVGLFLLTGLAALPWLRRPEAWLAVLALSMVWEQIPFRFLLGRPYLITVAALLSLLLFWRRFGSAPPRAWMVAVMTGLIAASVYFHGPWYLWVLPVVAFFCAGQIRWGLVVAGCAAGGVVLGCALTGHPLAYPIQAVRLALLCVGAHDTERSMASELQPLSGDTAALFLLGGVLLLRRLAGLRATPLLRDPVFWLVCLSWTLGFRVGRFWTDWGWPALMVLLAGDLELLLQARLAADAFRRLALAGGMAAVTFFCITTDINSHWTATLTDQFLSEADDPGIRGWMPEKGGIFYTADMPLFYRTFYRNPQGDWRYMLGFEPTWMPREDFEIYQSVLWNFGAPKAYEPWVKQLRLPDRLAIRGDPGSPPTIPELEWKYSLSGVWLGRLSGHHAESTPATVPAAASPAGKPS